MVTLDDIFDEAELIASDNTNKIIYMNPESAQRSEYNMEFYLSGANSEVARVIRAILRRVDEEIMNKENTELPTVVSAINESIENQSCFSRLWTRILNAFRRESAMQSDIASEYSSIKCRCCGMLFRSGISGTTNASNESSFVRTIISSEYICLTKMACSVANVNMLLILFIMLIKSGESQPLKDELDDALDSALSTISITEDENMVSKLMRKLKGKFTEMVDDTKDFFDSNTKKLLK
ncbi:hypothetical protein CBL_04319 [Carabus blaptoides fortunei]